MHVLFVTTHPPFPPVDGVRIPAANHLLALREKYHVDCLLLKCSSIAYTLDDVYATRKEVDNLWEVSMSSRGVMLSVLREIFVRDPFYGRWKFTGDLPSKVISNHYDLIWCGTAPAVAIVARAKNRRLLSASKYVAGLSDIHSLVLTLNARRADKSDSFLFRFIKNPLSRIRSSFLRQAEKGMLQHYDLCTMQTEREADWVEGMSEGLKNKILILPNGVNEALFAQAIDRKGQEVFFLGMLSSMYSQRIQWFFKNSWPKILLRYPNARATVIGRGATSEQDVFFKKNGIQYIPYVDDIHAVYRERAVMIAPIFKGYGIINKVLEAMAAGCLVVGDRTAFNGIDGFVDGEHGLVAETADEFAERVCMALESNDLLRSVRCAGRELIRSKFAWSERYARLLARVQK